MLCVFGGVPEEPLGAPRFCADTKIWYCFAHTKHTSFSLGGHFTAFIEAEVSKGRYASASEVVRAGLRLLEEREAHLTRLRAALAEGEESGPSAPFDFDAFLADKRTGR